MALSRREFADKLRTMNRTGSKAPLQNVQLPTNRTRYQTPSMRISAPEQPQGSGVNPAMLAKAGGLLGKAGKAAWDAYNTPEHGYDFARHAAPGLGFQPSLPNVAGLGGSGVDAAQGMANGMDFSAKAMNAPLPSMLGNGTPTSFLPADSMGLTGMADTMANVDSAVQAAQTGADAASAATDAAGAASMSVPVAPLVGAGISAASGNTGKAVGQAVGGVAGSYFGPLGTMAGSTIGGLLGDWIG